MANTFYFRNSVIAAPAFIAILPSILLIWQMDKLGLRYLIYLEGTKTCVLICAATYLTIGAMRRSGTDRKVLNILVSPSIAICSLTVTSLLGTLLANALLSNWLHTLAH